MKTNDEWSLVYYAAENGTKPVEEFLHGLDGKARAKILKSLEDLRVLNIRAREPLVKHIEDKLWELRERSNKNSYRVFYVFFTGKQIVLLHAFAKKTQKTPRQEIDTALRYLSHYQATQGEN